jgi:hypothetical protein
VRMCERQGGGAWGSVLRFKNSPLTPFPFTEVRVIAPSCCSGRGVRSWFRQEVEAAVVSWTGSRGRCCIVGQDVEVAVITGQEVEVAVVSLDRK